MFCKSIHFPKPSHTFSHIDQKKPTQNSVYFKAFYVTYQHIMDLFFSEIFLANENFKSVLCIWVSFPNCTPIKLVVPQFYWAHQICQEILPNLCVIWFQYKISCSVETAPSQIQFHKGSSWSVVPQSTHSARLNSNMNRCFRFLLLKQKL